MTQWVRNYNRSKNIFWQWTKWRFHHAMNTFQQMFWMAEFSLLQLVLEHSDFWAHQVVVWHSGKALVLSNEVNLCWARLVLGWVTMPRFNSWGSTLFWYVTTHPGGLSLLPSMGQWMSTSQKRWCFVAGEAGYGLFACKTVLPYLSALENAIVFKGALQMSRFTLLYFSSQGSVAMHAVCRLMSLRRHHCPSSSDGWRRHSSAIHLMCDWTAWHHRFKFFVVECPQSFFWLHSTLIIYIYTTTTTVLRPFFRDHPSEPMPEERFFWTLWC